MLLAATVLSALSLILALLVGIRGAKFSARSLRKALDDLEERVDYLQKQIRRLRGHVTGGIRYEEDDDLDLADSPSDFPEGRFQQLLEEKRHHGTG